MSTAQVAPIHNANSGEPRKSDAKTQQRQGAPAQGILLWSDKAPSSVHVSPRTPYPPASSTPPRPPRTSSPSPLSTASENVQPPMSPPRPRRPDSIVEDAKTPIYARFASYSPIADLGLQLEDIISTYAAEPSPERAGEDANVQDAGNDAPRLDAARAPPVVGSPTPLGAALAELGLDGPKTQPSTPILPGSERSRTLLSLAQRTLHLSSLPGYERRIDLLQRLEVAMGAFLSVEDVESILCIEATPSPAKIGPQSTGRNDVRRTIGRMRTSWRPRSRTVEAPPPSAPIVVGVPLSSLPLDAYVTATIAGRPYDLPILCFSAVEEIYRRGQGPPVKSFMDASGSATRLDQLVTIYETAPDYGERHDLSLESIHDVVSLLKRFLTSLPTPILDDKLWRLFSTACLRSTRPHKQRIESAQLILHLLPSSSFNLLLYLSAGFSQLPLFAKNPVSLDKVASLFGDAIFGSRSTVPRTASSKRFGMTITAPSELLSDSRDRSESAIAALRWLLGNWSAIAEGLLSGSDSPQESTQRFSMETLNISTAPTIPAPDDHTQSEAKAGEPVPSSPDKVLPVAPQQSSVPERPTEDVTKVDNHNEDGSQPALSPPSSASTSPRSDSFSTPPGTSAPLFTPADEKEANATLQRQLDEAIAMLTVRRASAESADTASVYAFPPPPPLSPGLDNAPAAATSDSMSPASEAEPASVQSPRIPIGMAAHRRSMSEDVTGRGKAAPPPLLRTQSAPRVRLAQPPSLLTPTIPENASAVPPPLPEKRQSVDISSSRRNSAPQNRTSLYSPTRTGTKNFLLPAHARRYDEIIHLRQRLSALEKEREAEHADMVNLRSEVALFKARVTRRTSRQASDDEQTRVAEAERRASDADSRAEEAEKAVASLKKRLEEVEKARRRESAEAKRTASNLEEQLRLLRDLVLEQ
ncbi:hypothetical protein JCM10908_003910 [Rhodotorula pacifica]|uniref:uncharacterized protein n=1 Tax=Rhodotorula pacifica TaxID=1495444 RepID=UPI003173ED70